MKVRINLLGAVLIQGDAMEWEALVHAAKIMIRTSREDLWENTGIQGAVFSRFR